MKTQGSHPVSNLKRKHHSKALRRSEKMHPAHRNKKNTLVEPFFNCLFTFTMKCGAYSNNAMSSRSSFTK
jgi:hypothetical protein